MPVEKLKIHAPEIPEGLPQAADLEALVCAARQEDDEIARVSIKGITISGVNFSKMVFSKVVFEGCRLTGCDFSRCRFSDVLFQSCDLSNCNFDDTSLVRCHFRATKAIGFRACGSALLHTRFTGCILRYTVFDNTILDRVEYLECDLTEAFLTACKPKFFAMEKCSLVRTNFQKTRLRGMDITSCTLEDIIVSPDFHELRGLVVDTFQAAELARMLGLIIQ